MEVRYVDDITLDTGCAKTLMRQHLVPSAMKLPGKAITVRCAHTGTVLYPLAEVELVVDGVVKVSPLKDSTSVGSTGHGCPTVGSSTQNYPLTIHTEGAG